MREKPLILLLDDEEVFLEIASVSLTSKGLEAVATRDFREALMKAESLLPDLVLSDIYMEPGPNGWEFALALRRNPKTHGLKIAFFTSLRDPWLELKKSEDEVRKELGDVIFVSKVDDVPVLADRVWGIVKSAV